jgi:hypothetical protein
LAGIGGFQLSVEGIGHSVQFHGVKLPVQHSLERDRLRSGLYAPATPCAWAISVTTLATLGAQLEKLGELHGRPDARFQLALHRPLVLAQDIRLASPLQVAGRYIQEYFDLPGLKSVASNPTAVELSDQASKPVEHQFNPESLVRCRHPIDYSPICSQAQLPGGSSQMD